jgi:hypothetical protein
MHRRRDRKFSYARGADREDEVDQGRQGRAPARRLHRHRRTDRREARRLFLLRRPNATTLRSLIDRLNQAKHDKKIRAVLITLGGEANFSFSQAQEIRDTLQEINRAGKKTFVYADAYDTPRYTLASSASRICLLEGGDVMIPGVGMEAMFARGLLDKVGVKADYIQIGEYKGADEQYTRTTASDQLKGEMNRLADRFTSRSSMASAFIGISRRQRSNPSWTTPSSTAVPPSRAAWSMTWSIRTACAN